MFMCHKYAYSPFVQRELMYLSVLIKQIIFEAFSLTRAATTFLPFTLISQYLQSKR